MSELTVHGNMLSPAVRCVAIFCKLSNIPYTHRDQNLLTKEFESEEFTRINPFQTMPAIVHNGYNLWESAAIVPYLADAFNVDNQWYPKDIKIRGRINAHLHWFHQGTWEPIALYIRPKLVAPKIFGAPELTEEAEAPLRARFNEWLSTFKWLLSETHYVARTERATAADIFVFSEFLGVVRFVNLSEHPEINAWFQEIAAIPEVHEVTQVFEEICQKLLG